ncbi:MAG: hypothetical protein K6T54_05730 [Ignavibacterium sp.]|nr:hypothetical protein [Ignavibacterium sp.]
MKIEVQILPLLNNPDKETSVNKLVEVSYKIAAQYLNFNFRRVNKILSSEELTLQELALDSIATLFEYDSEKQLSQLFIALRKWEPPVQNERDVESIVSSALKATFAKLSEYVTKGKISENEEIIFRKTLSDIVFDLRDGGMNKGLYKYFILNCDGLSLDVFQEKYHNKLE